VVTEYLQQHHLVVDRVAEIDPQIWRDHLRTPTALVVDPSGVIARKWTGQLDVPNEEKLQRTLGLNATTWWQFN